MPAQEDIYVTDSQCLVDLEWPPRVVALLKLLLRGEGAEDDFAFSIFLRNMRVVMYKCVASFLKSLQVGRVLTSSSCRAATLR